MPETIPQIPLLDAETFAQAIGDQELRRELVRQYGLRAWCLIYLSHYFELEPAEFFPELLANLDDDSIDALEIIGFRGGAKSTFTSTAYAIYAALEKPKLYPFIVLLVSTGDLAVNFHRNGTPILRRKGTPALLMIGADGAGREAGLGSNDHGCPGA